MTNASAARVASRFLRKRPTVRAIGDLAVFQVKLPSGNVFWRGSGDPRLKTGQYVAGDLRTALYYARNFAQNGFVTAYKISGATLDAYKNPVETLAEAALEVGLDPKTWDPQLDRVWEILEQQPGVKTALGKHYALVRFEDVAPTPGTVAYCYLDNKTLKGTTAAKVVSTQDLKKWLSAESRRLWGDPKALPYTERGWSALVEAQREEAFGLDVEPPDEYLDMAGSRFDEVSALEVFEVLP